MTATATKSAPRAMKRPRSDSSIVRCRWRLGVSPRRDLGHASARDARGCQVVRARIELHAHGAVAAGALQEETQCVLPRAVDRPTGPTGLAGTASDPVHELAV